MASSSLKHLLRALIAQHAASLAVRSWRSASLGSLSSLRLETTPQEPLTEPDQVRVEVRAVGLNFADIFSVLGLYKAANEVLAGQRDRAGFCPGLEFAGVVTECGPAATSSVQVGERVFGFARFGAFRSEVVARAPLVRKIPSDWSFEEGASLLVQGLTAWHGLVELGGAERGGRALVHAAAGGVGLHTLQICDALGLASTAVVSGGVDGEKASLVRARAIRPRASSRARAHATRERTRRSCARRSAVVRPGTTWLWTRSGVAGSIARWMRSRRWVGSCCTLARRAVTAARHQACASGCRSFPRTSRVLASIRACSRRQTAACSDSTSSS